MQLGRDCAAYRKVQDRVVYLATADKDTILLAMTNSKFGVTGIWLRMCGLILDFNPSHKHSVHATDAVQSLHLMHANGVC